jgi:inorganic triphosphatase YgiF
MERETEIKLASTPHMLDVLKRDARFRDGSVKQTLVSTYFDTDDYRLTNARVRLRLRTGGGKIEQTMKRAHKGSSTFATQMEHSCCLDREELDLAAFPPSTRKIVERLAAGKPLMPVARTYIERETRIIKYRRATIEAAFDSGTIEAAGRSGEICELELELKRGSLRGLLSLARRLPLGPDLGWSASSKGTRAIGLAANLAEMPGKPGPVSLKPTMSRGMAFQHIAWNCLNHLLRNYRLILDHRNAEALHQCRVALRRLRIATSIFQESVGDGRAALLVAEWKAIAAALGQGRTLDVIIARLMAQESPAVGSANPALPMLERLRRRAYDGIVALAASASFQHMLFDTALWIEGFASPARPQPDADPKPESLLEFASKTIAKQRKRLKKPVRNIKALSKCERHRLRIKAKRMRYTTEFFSSLLGLRDNARRLQNFLKAQEAVQDILGELNDIAPCKPPELGGVDDLDPIEQAAVKALMMETAEIEPGVESKLLKVAARAGKAMLEAGKPWK